MPQNPGTGETEGRGAGPSRRLDTRGSFCPIPVIETAEAMRALAAGETLEILADDVGVKLDLPAWCRANRQRLVAIEEEPGLIRVTIMKTGDVV